jgi:hypothetical protein
MQFAYQCNAESEGCKLSDVGCDLTHCLSATEQSSG